MPRIRVPQSFSAGLFLTYCCPSACRHCLYACSPAWPADWPGLEELEACLAALSRRLRPHPWGPRTVGFNYGLHFTGGEPFLNFELLLDGVRLASEYRLPSLFVETNCFWCRDDDLTRDRLLALKGAGLHGLLVSVNPFTVERIPFERLERAIRLGQQVFGRNLLIYQVEFYHLFRQQGLQGTLPLEDFLTLFGPRAFAGTTELLLAGRAAYRLQHLFPVHPAERFLAQPCPTPLLRNWHNHVDNYGNLLPGFCGGLSLGHWRDLDRLETEGLELQEYPILKYLISGDMAGLLDLARAHGYRTRPAGYISKCHLCLDLRKCLADQGDFRELRPREFYKHLEND
ncbi:MAG: radical SAM protein [Deltaproteobacteria bacterium]|nr:radical SAM protein [Deltaproteobacteria bacterium]